MSFSSNDDERRLSAAAWGIATPVVAVLIALIPLILNPRFYFYDDTQIGAYPIWFEIGSQLRKGVWPVFSAEGWQAGNHAAEGQWGIYSVLTMALGLIASVAPNAVVMATVVKLVFLATASLGIFLVARSFGVTSPFALVAGTASVMAGFTVYLDASSWVTGLMVWSILPWVWWALRRMVVLGGSPVPPIFLGYLLVSVGYVHGTIMLVLLLLAVLLEVASARDWRQLRRVVGVGAVLGLVALAVYLPGVLTLQATARSTVIDNSGYLTADLTGLASSTLPTASPQVSAPWWGNFAPAPLLYIAWFLPLLALVDFSRLRSVLARRASVPAYLVLAAVVLLAPSDLGPLRTPVRIMPYISLTVILLFAIAVSLARIERPGRARWITVSGIFVGSAYLGWTGNPDSWKYSALVCAVMAGGFGAVWVVLQRERLGARSAGSVAGILVIVGAIIAVPQHMLYPRPPVQDFLLSADVNDYRAPLAGAVGQSIVVGAPSTFGDQAWGESLVGNSWYLNEHPVHNLYSPTQNAAYATDLCMTARGETCAELATALFELDPTTERTLADLLRIDSIQIVAKSSDLQRDARDPPPGWAVRSTSDTSVLWTRNDALGDVGAPSWASPGTRVTTLSNTAQEVRFEIDEVPDGGGEIVLSRIDWPGYAADNAILAPSLRDYLLTVRVAGGSAGDVVTVRFDPPGWSLEIASLAGATVLTAGWGGFFLLRRGSRAGERGGVLLDRRAA